MPIIPTWNSIRCVHGVEALHACPTCRRLRANEAAARNRARRVARARALALIEELVGPVDYDERERLLAGMDQGPPLRTPADNPLARTCEHGIRPRCDKCRRALASARTQRWKRRKRAQYGCEGGLKYPDET